MRTKKAVGRRMGAAGSEIRARLLDEAAKLLKKEGCGAVTARRLAEKLGLKRQIVHYYFATIEDLLIAVIKRDSDAMRERFTRELTGRDPLSVIWELGNKVPPTIFEFTALALRRKAIQTAFRRYIAEFRKIETAAIERYLQIEGIQPRVPPVAMAILISGICHTLSIERALGTIDGHAELEKLVAGWLKSYVRVGALSQQD
jgi:TetR/AcrR family transcriptional regulator